LACSWLHNVKGTHKKHQPIDRSPVERLVARGYHNYDTDIAVAAWRY